MRTLYDAIYPANIPSNAEMVACYVDGNWPNYPDACDRFPNAVHVSIATQGADAQVLDVEAGNTQPDQAPAWITRQRARGQIPTVYCNVATWPAVVAACKVQGVAPPIWWAADWDRDPTITDGAIAKQHTNDVAPGYDISSVADHWPGVDPEPTEEDLTPEQAKQLADTAWLVKNALGPAINAIRAAVHVLGSDADEIIAALKTLPDDVRQNIKNNL